jgi:NitT/TauT family transport system substrate-binding protein
MIRTRILATLLVAALAALGAGGCSPAADTAGGDDTAADALPIRIGAMPITAALTIFVADEQGLFAEEGLDATVDVFPSAADRNTALTAGAIDCTQGDPVSLFLLEEGGFPVSAVTIVLGATVEEGRHGIVAGPGVDAETMADLAGVPVGTSLNTHQEYCVDSLFEFQGFVGDDVVKEEVKKVPIRYELLMEGQLQAAALPEPWLTLAIHNGATLIASDTECSENISAVYLFAADEFLATADGAEAMTRALRALDRAADLVNDDPDAYRDLLVDRAGVPDEIRDTLFIDTYPSGARPAADDFDHLEDWMLTKGLIPEHVAFEDLTWFPAD